MLFVLRREREANSACEIGVPNASNKNVKEIAKESFKVSLKVSLVVLFAVSAIHFLSEMGFVQLMIKAASRLDFRCFPHEVMPVSFAHALHLAAGAAVGGKLLAMGIPGKKILLGMLWGYVLGTPIRGAINILPRYCALFGVSRGFRAWCTVQLFRSLVGATFAICFCRLLVGL